MITFKPFKKYMLENDLSPDDIKHDLGFSNDTITRISKGRDVKLSTVEKICKKYHLKIEDVVQIK